MEISGGLGELTLPFSQVIAMVQGLNEFKMNGAFITHDQRKYDVWQSWIWLGERIH